MQDLHAKAENAMIRDGITVACTRSLDLASHIRSFVQVREESELIVMGDTVQQGMRMHVSETTPSCLNILRPSGDEIVVVVYSGLAFRNIAMCLELAQIS